MNSRYVSGRIGRTILPISDDLVNLGHQTARFGSIYLTGNTIDLDGATISTDPSGELLLNTPSGNVRINANVATFLGSVEVSPIAFLINSGTTAERPLDAVDGTIFINLENDVIEFYSNGAWVIGSGAGGASVNASNVLPIQSEVGDLWFDTDTGALSVYYDSSWVVASGQTGPAGPAGQNGPVGSTGATGPTGATGAASTGILNIDGGYPSSVYGGITSFDAGGVT